MPWALSHYAFSTTSGRPLYRDCPSKDVIDVQIIVERLDRQLIVDAVGSLGFEMRRGEWNLHDHIPGVWNGDPRLWSKLVFAPLPRCSCQQRPCQGCRVPQ